MARGKARLWGMKGQAAGDGQGKGQAAGDGKGEGQGQAAFARVHANVFFLGLSSFYPPMHMAGFASIFVSPNSPIFPMVQAFCSK